MQLWAWLGRSSHALSPEPVALLTSLSDLADAFPGGDYGEALRAEWMTQLVREVRSSQEYSARTKETARWAREQIKRQGTGQGTAQGSQLS